MRDLVNTDRTDAAGDGRGRLELDDVSVRYEDTVAVDHVSLDLSAGEILAVLGPSGCGKSSLLRAIVGVEPLAGGHVRLDGRLLDGVPTHRRGIGLMFQDGQLFEHLSVAANIGYPLRIRRTGRPVIADRVTELLELVGLSGYADRRPGELSGGERQRVALARVLAMEPALLLLDEPLSALDTALRERLATDLARILREAGTTTLLVTHDHDEAFALADTMAVMRAGKVVQHGPVGEVWAGPADVDTALFLGYARVLPPESAARLLADEPVGGGLALRRSALDLDPSGRLQATVLSSRATPEQLRLVVDVDGVGELDAVAPHGSHAGPGDRVSLAVDRSRLAVLPVAG